jgi:L-asparaginase II
MVAGPGTFTTRLIAATGGRVLGKEGAEGTYSLAVRGPVALGVVVKIADGGERARPGVVLDVLRQLGSLSAAELAALEDLRSPPVINANGDEVGRIVPDVELEEGGELGEVGAPGGVA